MLKTLISAQTKKMLDEAIASELYASHLYRHLANQLQRLGYFGAQKYFLSESEDELKHYQLHVEYQNDSGTVANVPSVPAITEKIGSLLDALEVAYETEVQLGEDYAKYYTAADPTTQQFLLQFLKIQRDSVGDFADLIARLRQVDGDKCGILLDRKSVV